MTAEDAAKPTRRSVLTGALAAAFLGRGAGHAAAATGPMPPTPIGGMGYVDWSFPDAAKITSLTHQVKVLKAAAPGSDVYLQLYESMVGTTHQYYGLQTTSGRAIFSAFDLTDPKSIRLGPGSSKVVGNDEGQYLSVRHDFGKLPVGLYKTEMRRAEPSGANDWFDYFVTFPSGKRSYIGGIRFPRVTPTVPLTFDTFGGSWVEFWDNNGDVFYPVPTWSVAVSATANNGKTLPKSVTTLYSAREDGASMPQSNIRRTAGNFFQVDIGESVKRVTPAQTYDLAQQLSL